MSPTASVCKRLALVYVLCVSFPFVYCGLIENINAAIVSNFHDDIVNVTGTKTDVVREFVKTFTKLENEDDIHGSDELEIACAYSSNLSSCKQYLKEECINVDELVENSLKESHNLSISDWIPPVLYRLHSTACIDEEQLAEQDRHGKRKKPTSAQAWGYGVGFVTSICLVSNVGGIMAPFMKKDFFQRMLLFCVSLAVGTLAATGFLVLIPESMELTTEDSPVPDYHFKMATVMGGVYFFYISERLLKIWFSRPKKHKGKKGSLNVSLKVNGGQGHSHFPADGEDIKTTEKLTEDIDTTEELTEDIDTTEELAELTVEEGDSYPEVKRKRKLTTIALMILIGDALHNFVDGIAIGAAFTENTYLGISVSLSVICEELPHELGDIAILLHSGLNMRRSLCYNFLAALTCYAGLVVGILLGENTDANMWIFAVAGGMFVYISLVDMIPEMSDQMQKMEEKQTDSKWTAMLIQNLGLITGFVIIMMLVMYGGNIEV